MYNFEDWQKKFDRYLFRDVCSQLAWEAEHANHFWVMRSKYKSEKKQEENYLSNLVLIYKVYCFQYDLFLEAVAQEKLSAEDRKWEKDSYVVLCNYFYGAVIPEYSYKNIQHSKSFKRFLIGLAHALTWSMLAVRHEADTDDPFKDHIYARNIFLRYAIEQKGCLFSDIGFEDASKKFEHALKEAETASKDRIKKLIFWHL